MRTLLIFCFCSIFLLSTTIAEAASVPQLTSAMGRELDRQVAQYLGQAETPAQGLSIFVTTPVDNNNLTQTNALARQVQEELMRWFVQAGYPLQELRKGADILFKKEAGEFILTREERLLGSKAVTSSAFLAGTYTITPMNVRFNMRLIQTTSRQVIAMSTITIPITEEVAALIQTERDFSSPYATRGAIQPTVISRLP